MTLPTVKGEMLETPVAPGLAADLVSATPASTESRSLQLRDAVERTALPYSARHRTILYWMALSIALVTGLAFWSEERESEQALLEFARQQTTLALSVAGATREELATNPTALANPPRLLRIGRTVERSGIVRVLFALPGAAGLLSTRGERARSPALERAVVSGRDSLRLSRSEAAGLGLPARTAAAGVSAFDTAAGRFAVMVVASAQTERDRELRARWRLVLGLGIVCAVVLGFGGLAMRKQRKQLELAHALALSTLRTERNERLVRADKLATMGALATGIAHEVSTPLGVILGRAEQLLPKQLDERSRRSVEIITAQTERIDAVIRGFLALARGSRALLDHSEPAALVRAAIELVEHRFEKANVALSIDVDADLPKVSCDPRLFEQVLVNLLLNACDACDAAGKVEIRVKLSGSRVAFMVADDGVGISPGAAERVTEPFFTTKPEGKGTGLGLAIANEIVKHHGGTLALGAAPNGRGTCALVELPALPDPNHG